MPVQPGYPDDFAVRPAHALQLDWWANQRNFIDVWLPEGVFSDDGKTVWFLLREATDLHWRRAGGGWHSDFEKPGHCRVQASVTNRDDGVDLQLKVSNLTDYLWPRARAPVCVQLAAAPDFRDPELERTLFRQDDQWQPFDHHSVRRAYPGGCHFFGSMAAPGSAAGRSEIRVVSRCGNFRLAHGFAAADGVGGNCHESICCIHANPLLGVLAPGQSAVATGWLRLQRQAAAR